MKKLLAFIFVAILGLGLFACAAGTDSAASGLYNLSYTGKTLTVKLAENPTTGYVWHLSTSNDTIKLADDKYMRDGGNPGADGVGGVHTYRFEGVEEGQVTIVFREYRDPEDEVGQLSIFVEVNSNGSIKSATFENS